MDGWRQMGARSLLTHKPYSALRAACVKVRTKSRMARALGLRSQRPPWATPIWLIMREWPWMVLLYRVQRKEEILWSIWLASVPFLPNGGRQSRSGVCARPLPPGDEGVSG